MGHQPVGLDAPAMQSMPVPITTHQHDLTWLQVLFRLRCPVCMQKPGKGHTPWCCHLPQEHCLPPPNNTPQPTETLFARDSHPHSHILEKQPAFQPRKFPAQLIRWKHGQFTSKKLLPFTPPLKKYNATKSWFSVLLLHPHPRSYHWGHNLVHMLPTDQTFTF